VPKPDKKLPITANLRRVEMPPEGVWTSP